MITPGCPPGFFMFPISETRGHGTGPGRFPGLQQAAACAARPGPRGGPSKETGVARHILLAFPFLFPAWSRVALAVKDTGTDRDSGKGKGCACCPHPFARLPCGQLFALRPPAAPLHESLMVRAGHFFTATTSRDGDSPSKGQRQKTVIFKTTQENYHGPFILCFPFCQCHP